MSNSETQKDITKTNTDVKKDRLNLGFGLTALPPPWMHHLLHAINDGIDADQVPWFSGAMINSAARWHVLDDAAWKRIHTKILIAGVRQAIATASTLHQTNPLTYWPQVMAACEQVCLALETGEGLPEAEKAAKAAAYEAAGAAYAAYAAARATAYVDYGPADGGGYAARAAYAAASAAAIAAAYAPTYAADAAAYEAAGAAYAAYAAARDAAAAAARDAAYAAARAARAAAWKASAESLFKLIDAELDGETS